MSDFGELKEIFGGNCLVTAELTEGEQKKAQRYAIDQVGDDRYRRTPGAVVFPTETAQVAALMKWANRTGTPVTPRGAGSGLAGAAVPVEGGVVCSFEKMNRILEIDTENLMVVVEPGVVTNALDEALKPHNLFFAGYPMSEDICYVGGNVAENAGGGRAVKYGTTSTYVLGAQVVTPTGEILNLGGKRLKDVTGYNLLQLVVGSEGTLGLLTRLVIRVIPRPRERCVLFAAFEETRSATLCIAELKSSLSDGPSAVEFIDGETARRTNESLPAGKRSKLPDGAEAFLLVEFDGATEDGITRLLEGAKELVRRRGGTIDTAGMDEATVEDAWRLRKQIAWWVKRTAGAHHSLEDVVVPPASVPQLVAFVDGLRSKYEVPVAVFGHAGDGNFHVTPMKAESMAPEEWDTVVKSLLKELYGEVLRLGGTISGEHGIGRKRTGDLVDALSREEYAAMYTIKKALDPANVLNPGVIFQGE
ncbi:MAG: FAD-binding oxidoreductase [Spirochaetaceae bacterium]